MCISQLLMLALRSVTSLITLPPCPSNGHINACFPHIKPSRPFDFSHKGLGIASSDFFDHHKARQRPRTRQLLPCGEQIHTDEEDFNNGTGLAQDGGIFNAPWHLISWHVHGPLHFNLDLSASLQKSTTSQVDFGLRQSIAVWRAAFLEA
ncbi:hypothetical protein ARMGADRAFT_1039203 [Armillaria gallica]|uniref:Uncharacterized protein n=1 Tax=Armillaria gallica TaxID=47427 RepID=A0A2H3CEX9_ARMGA|nr:hypothetical protein ARMGADRAFT_1039203 [Armillaria gallica]